MIGNLIKYLQFGNQFCGIEHTTKNGHDTLVVTVLKKSKKKVNVEDSFEVDSINGLTSKLSKKQHIYLVLNNDKILTKRIESNQVDHLKLVNKAFPNIDVGNFYYEILHQNNSHYVFICRKDYVDKLIIQYQDLGFSILNVFLGVSIISSISNFINSETIWTSNSKLTFKEKSVVSIEKEEHKETQSLDINGLKTDSLGLLSLSGGLNSILQNYHANTNFGVQKQLLLEDYNHKRFFNQFSKIGLFFIFGLLLINFLFFNHYFNKVNDLQQLSQVNQSAKTNFLKLGEQVNKTQKMVDDMLKSNSSKSSFYANDIIQSLPKTILLSELNYQPLLKRIKSDQAITVNNNSIIVSGESNDSALFSNWVSELDNKDWIKKIDILDYGAFSKSISEFSFKITIENGK